MACYQNVEVTVTGQNLVGKFFLKKGSTEIEATKVQVKETAAAPKHVSNLTEAKATFNTSQPAGTGYELILKNAAGTSNAISGFEIVN
jgi:hypothetical protein